MSHIERLRALVDPRGLDVIDIGAGQGAFVGELNGLGARAVGVEIEAEKVARARDLSGTDIRLGTAEHLPVADNSFDLLTYLFSFHHIPQEHHAAALSEAARVLRPGGRVFVAEPRLDGDMTRIVSFIDDETDVRTAAQASLATLPPQYGFTIETKGSYTLTRIYADFDALLDRLVSVDPARAAAADAPGIRGKMRERFTALGEKTAEGHAIHQTVDYILLRRT